MAKKRGQEDMNETAFRVAGKTTGMYVSPIKAKASKGGAARRANLSPERRREIASKAAKARWDSLKLSFLIMREGNLWVAHGLEHNIVASSRELKDIKTEIESIVKVYFKVGGFDAIRALPQAKAKYWQRFIIAVRNDQSLDKVLERQATQEQVPTTTKPVKPVQVDQVEFELDFSDLAA